MIVNRRYYATHTNLLRLHSFKRYHGTLIQPERLAAFCNRLLQHIGCPEDQAQLVSSNLVESNLKGHDSHGVGYLPLYVRGILSKRINTSSSPIVSEPKPGFVHVDGKFSLGQVVGKSAIEIGVSRAKQYGFCMVSLKNSHHLGRIGKFAELCVEQNLCSIHFTNVAGHDPLVAAFGGKNARLGTNPITIGWCLSEPPIVLDMATSELALGKVREHMGKKESTPDGALLDSEGHPTTDASVMFREPRGCLLPFGKHKGYALAFMCELLGGVLAGGNTIHPKYERTTDKDMILNSMTTIIFDPQIMLRDGHIGTEETHLLRQYMKASELQDPNAPVLVPGEKEFQEYHQRKLDGISISEGTLEALLESAETAGLADAREILLGQS